MCVSGRERAGICQWRLRRAERSVQFTVGTDCVMNRNMNSQCC